MSSTMLSKIFTSYSILLEFPKIQKLSVYPCAVDIIDLGSFSLEKL